MSQGRNHRLAKSSDFASYRGLAQTPRLVESWKQFLLKKPIQQPGMIGQSTYRLNVELEPQLVLNLRFNVAGDAT